MILGYKVLKLFHNPNLTNSKPYRAILFLLHTFPKENRLELPNKVQEHYLCWGIYQKIFSRLRIVKIFLIFLLWKDVFRGLALHSSFNLLFILCSKYDNKAANLFFIINKVVQFIFHFNFNFSTFSSFAGVKFLWDSYLSSIPSQLYVCNISPK